MKGRAGGRSALAPEALLSQWVVAGSPLAPQGPPVPIPPWLQAMAAPVHTHTHTHTLSSSHSPIFSYYLKAFNLDQPCLLPGVPSSGHNPSAPLPKGKDLSKQFIS